MTSGGEHMFSVDDFVNEPLSAEESGELRAVLGSPHRWAYRRVASGPMPRRLRA